MSSTSLATAEPFLTLAARRLAAAGIATAEADAETIAMHVAGVTSLGELEHVATLGPLFEELIARRAQRVPLARLLGATSFRGITLQLGPGVFTPQPETSSMVQWAVDAVLTRGLENPLVVDLCTGAGTVALSLANEIAGATVHGVERDPQALSWALRNAHLRKAAGDPPVLMHLGDAQDCLPELDGQCDLIASNPPYVADHEGHIPAPEVLGHDPDIALWAGEDGLDIIRLVERSAARLLKPDGLVVVEHSDRQGLSAPAVFRATGDWTDVQDHVDDQGLDRFVTARRARFS